MRIRNSRLSCSMLPLPPEEAPRNTRFSSRGPCFDDRFLVEEVNRHIKWSSCPLRRTSDLDARAAQSHDQSQMALAGEAKSLNHVEREIGRENNMLESPSHVNQKVEETGNGRRKSNLSRTSNREGDRPRFSTHIVLALRATSIRPERELPLKKRIYRWSKTERVETGKRAKAAVTRGNADATTIPEQEAKMEVKMDTTSMHDNLVNIETALTLEKENPSECDGNQRSKSINCLLNQEASLPSPIIHVQQGQESGENLFLGGTSDDWL
ncbi:uncharacterized protein LOC110616963 isoform X2 [Manihot esculenta]|uniref:uncharacterized protein LOC110616963 isoform X2 n=1 Tax=Manihot esculenta TaxID=3983 RepID=UPI001CC5B2D0|nr:uncharacterized protein LOC110616963 isoform X2 [Manihot esculenta]